MLPSLPLPGSKNDSALPQIDRVAARRPSGFHVRWRWVFALLLLLAVAWAVKLVLDELRTSEYQARQLARIANEATFEVEPGPSPSIRYPSTGPYDERLGYTSLPDFVARLSASGFEIESQARHSPRLQALEDWGLSPVYREKDRAGLRIVGSDGTPLFSTRYPSNAYDRFEDVPKAVVDALLFVENREVLDMRYPMRNPAVEWDRLGRAALSQVLQVAGADTERAGGSTLATQLEKFRHSPQGLTSSPLEKLRQMASASLRAYQDGANTTRARKRIVLDYVNSIPLAAAPPYGEVIGLGDALSIWYGADFAKTNAILRQANDPSSVYDLETRARAYKRTLSLVLSAGRPSYYLIQDPKALLVRTDTFLRLLANEGVISVGLRDAALASELELRRRGADSAPPPPEDRKSASAVRARLVALLGLSDYYALDRLDLDVETTVMPTVQEGITRELRSLRDPERAREAGFVAKNLLEYGDPSKLVYSFTLYERGDAENHLLVQADNLDQPLDMNEGSKLDLGSTAKLRTLATYLEIVAELHSRFAGEHRATLRAIEVEPADRITRFVIDQLIAQPGMPLAQLLDAALARRYSANPWETFYTGGGEHHFGNFNKDDDEKEMSVRSAFTLSVNLIFIRLMRDVVNYYIHQAPGSSAALLKDPKDPRREQYLKRFADQEGRIYLDSFWRKYHGKPPEEIRATLLRGVRMTPKRVAMALRAALPDAPFEEFQALLLAQLPDAKLAPAMQRKLYDSYSPARFTLADQGYIAGVHPLELWLVGYLGEHPDATLRQIFEASADERIAVYHWLFSRHRKRQQDRRIRSLLEIEAFLEVHRNWQAHGYPFDSLVPSLATAIGSAADRPSSLAELAGIIVNDGVRKPSVRIARLRFASDTPYETRLTPAPTEGTRVMPEAVARAIREAMVGVVDHGTAVRARGALVAPDGRVAVVGGKTGTGDHRFKVFGPGGKLRESRVVNRTATFVFVIDDRYYGVITAFVHGPEAAGFGFTSSLPAQIFKTLAPSLSPLLASDPLTSAGVAGVVLADGGEDRL
ncbi:MAG: transglycosylase domain-containing protein [Myxococcota bacterium]